MNFPIELINHILAFRPKHPIAVLINNEFVKFRSTFRVLEETYDNKEFLSFMYIEVMKFHTRERRYKSRRNEKIYDSDDEDYYNEEY